MESNGLSASKLRATPWLRMSASFFVLLLFPFATTPALASPIWEPVNVTTGSFVDTLADGTVVTVTFGTAAGYWGSAAAPAFYKTDASGGRSDSFVKFSFNRPVTSLKTFYAYLGVGDDERFTTNLGDVDLSSSFASGGNLVSSTGGFISGQPEGVYTSNGTVSSPSGDRSATLQLQFSTGITWLEVRGAPPGGGVPGINLTGLEIELFTTTVTFDANSGSGSMSNQIGYGTAALSQNTFTREGFTFAGWNTSADGSGTPLADGASYDFSSTNRTLYAQWTAIASTPTATPTTAPATTTPLVTLATTGANLEWLLVAGLLAVIAGSGFLAFSRRKRV